VSGVVSEPSSPPSPAAVKARARSRLLGRLGAFVLACLGLGAVAGVFWESVVVLPSYEVRSDGGATTTERGLTEFFAGDAWFCVIGLVLFLVLSTLAWLRFREVGWPLVLVMMLTALAAGLICWAVGYQLGPGEFPRRLAEAQPGAVVPIELTLRARASLLSWPFAAVIPLLLGSSLGRDDEEPGPLVPRRWRRASAGQQT